MRNICVYIAILLITMVHYPALGCDTLKNFAAHPDATSVFFNWDPVQGVAKYRLKATFCSDQYTISTEGCISHRFTWDTPGGYYTVEGLDEDDNIICTSPTIYVEPTDEITLKTRYNLLAIVFDPGHSTFSEDDLRRIKTFLKYRVEFLKHASFNSVNLDLFNSDIVVIDAYPPSKEMSSLIDYVKLASTRYPELSNKHMVDLVESRQVDIVWVLGAPDGYDFGENILMGNRSLGYGATGSTWYTAGVECSRSFFIHSNSPDARAFDAAAHHVEGMMTSMDYFWMSGPRMDFMVYTNDPTSDAVYNQSLMHFERFRLTDEWNGVGAYASKGNANCGSSHFIPGSIRNSSTYPDYTYYDPEAWQRYVYCYADDWLNYPDFSGTPRKLNGYEHGAFNHYEENTSVWNFSFGTASFHYWWFNHIPHNPGVSNRRLNNWWPYIYDCNRFDGRDIHFAVNGFPEVPQQYFQVNEEWGTEEDSAGNWMFWHSASNYGQRADLSVVNKSEYPEFVKSGNHALKVDVDIESYGYEGRNDCIFPCYKNARMNLKYLDSVEFSMNFPNRELVLGTNPVFRICKNGSNRIEYVPKKNRLYTNSINDVNNKDNKGWYTFKIPVGGDQTWERNIIGYVDPDLSIQEQELKKQEIMGEILNEVNYFEISTRTVGNSGDSLVYYIDNLRTILSGKDTATIEFSNLYSVYDGSPVVPVIKTNPANLNVVVTYNGSDIPPVNAGTWNVEATIDDLFYTGFASAELRIDKLPANINLGSLRHVYDGNPKKAIAGTIPEGLPVIITYDGMSDAPVNAGSYGVTGEIEHVNYTGISSESLIISPAKAMVLLKNLEVVYNGTPRLVSVETFPSNLKVEVKYKNSMVSPVNAGSYVVEAKVKELNYYGDTSGIMVISRAYDSLDLGTVKVSYDGREKEIPMDDFPRGIVTNITYNDLTTPPKNVGIYAIRGTAENDNLYLLAKGTLEIMPANLIVSAKDTSREEGTPNPEFHLRFSGFVNNENISILDTLPVAGCEASLESPPGIYDIVVHGGHDNNYEFWYFPGKLTVLDATKIEKKELQVYQFYPNPVRDIMSIRGTGENLNLVKIIDMYGRLILVREVKTGQDINLINLQPGIYHLLINDKYFKLVKE